MAEIIHEIPIRTTPSALYAMLTEQELLSRWWLPGAKMEAIVGAIGTFPLPDGQNQITMQVEQLVPNKMVVWRCLGHKFPEWEGTRISFEIRKAAPELTVVFRQTGWGDTGGVFGKTSFYWAALYLKNLKQALEKQGAGHAFTAFDRFTLTKAKVINQELERAFDLIANGRIFGLTGASCMEFKFEIGEKFKLDFAGRGSVSGMFKEIARPYSAAVSWRVTGFDRPDETTEVAFSLTKAEPGKTGFEVVHTQIPSLDSLNAKATAWEQILAGIIPIP